MRGGLAASVRPLSVVLELGGLIGSDLPLSARVTILDYEAIAGLGGGYSSPQNTASISKSRTPEP